MAVNRKWELIEREGGQAQYPRGNIQLLAHMIEDFLLPKSLRMGGVHKPSHLGMLKIGSTWIYSCPARCYLCHSSGKADMLGNILKAALSTVQTSIRVALINIHTNWPFIVTAFCKCQCIWLFFSL